MIETTSERQWRTMDSAPKDGTRVDLWIVRDSDRSAFRVPDCWWDNDRWWHCPVTEEGFFPYAILGEPDCWVLAIPMPQWESAGILKNG